MDYYHINSLLKVKEIKVIDDAKYEILLKCDKDSFLDTLSNIGFGYLEKNKTFEEIMYLEEESFIKDLIFYLGEDHFFIKTIRLFHDLINIKLYFNSLLLNNNENIFDSLSNYTISDITKAFNEKNYDYVEEDKPLFEEINKIDLKKSYKKISNEITKIFYDYLYNTYIIKGKEDFITYYKVLVTNINILNSYKEVLINKTNEDFDTFIINNSYVSNDVYQKIFKGNDNTSFEDISIYLPLRYEDMFKKNLDINMLIHELDRIMIKLSFELCFSVDSLGYIISYYIKKEFERKNIKKIYYYKANKVHDLYILKNE